MTPTKITILMDLKYSKGHKFENVLWAQKRSKSFLFLEHNSKSINISKNASTNVPFRADFLFFEVPYVKIGELLLPENEITGKKNF